jgi:hypothetical protein
METEPSSKPPITPITEWGYKNWRSILTFAAGTLVGAFVLGAFAAQQGYEGISWGGTEYVLLKKASVPKSLLIQGSWIYETKTSDTPLVFNKLECKSIMGTVDISQAATSNEFNVNNATRRKCIDFKSRITETNVGWRSISAAVLPNSRKIIISLRTDDANPRIGYIEGAIPTNMTGDMPSQFDGTMYYLDTRTQKYGRTTITFCKNETECAKNITRKFTPVE